MHSKSLRDYTRGRRTSCKLFHRKHSRIDGRRLSYTFGHRFAPTLGTRDSSFLGFHNKVFTFARAPARLCANLDRVFARHASSQTLRVTCRPLSVLRPIPDSRPVPPKSWCRVSWALFTSPPFPRDERTSRASTGTREKKKR